ncbi:UPF0182 family protein [Fimbriimonas ginsengisoli]|uniref:Uncharacterized protein n=1 Tax=Fimbriimonas ginsengisoli Gsoil 348 TaxID=661478 RepID=A0A068NTU4_FIMGI|nr:UPF0182 family protein [Fimbriimonas ginsengisoli]AIE86861.1 hypothetical protein OP10G_3493 [Fimbriimonas ginsengisoli Gsoil 348]
MHPELDIAQVRKAVRVGSILLGILVVAGILFSTVKPYTTYLWFAHDVRQPQIFSIGYSARGWLFLASFGIAWVVLYANLHRALGVTLVFLRAPETSGQVLIANTVQWIQQRGRSILWYGAPAFAFFTAVGFSNEWNTLLLWRNGGSFGVKDPMYGLDIGFYVFTLPWYRAVVNGVFSLFLLTTVLCIGVYVGLQALSSLAKIELSRPGFRWHVSGLLGATLLVFAAQTWLKTYEAGLIDSGQFTGAGYAAAQAVVAARIFAVLVALLGVATIVFARVGKPYGIPMGGGIGVVIFYAGGVVIYPWLVQRLAVDPNRLAKEAPYAARAIKMSRYAYGLDKIETRDFDVQKSPSAEEIKASGDTLANMRLWDPEVLKQSLQRLQAIRPYYSFSDVDIDRYQIDGKQTMLMLSPRDIDLDGLDAGARNWTNERLRFTHGYGVDVSQVNAATADGQPALLAQDIPQRTNPNLPITQPRLYFSDLRDASLNPVDEYAIVNTGEPELDYQTPTASETHRWQGGRGVPIGGFLSRLAFAIALGDGNLLVSGNIGADSRLLVRRNVIDRASTLMPFLRFDRDPYLVLLGGKSVWVLDGYTTTDMLPYAEMVNASNGGLNYIRNSVKVTIDAYTGEVRAYAIEPDEPVLRAYRKIYPGLVRDIAEAPPGLPAHFRYPEDMFALQCAQLTNYHVVDPTSFLSNADGWDIAAERDLRGIKAPIPPYYVQMRLPDEPQSGFLQILPFTPRGRPTMSGWIAAHCDPGQYGRLTLYRFATGIPIPGPELMEGNFTSTPEISNINRQFNNEQSEIVVGNLLVVPIGHSVMYAEPLYLRSKATGIMAAPRLFRVILALPDRIVVGDSYADALTKLFGTAEEPPVATGPGVPPSKGTTSVDRKAVQKALEMFEQADAALRKGDFAKYGEYQKELRKRLQELAK